MERPSSKYGKREVQVQEQPAEANQEQEEFDLDQAIQMLQGHQKKWEEEGKYVEAEMAKNRVKELKKQLQERRDFEAEMNYQADLEELEQTHIQEFNRFNEEWDVKMNEFQVHSAGLLKALEGKHEQEIKDYREDIEKNMVDNFKASTELIQLISTQKNLAKQQEYQQAHLIQNKAQELEAKERMKYEQERDKKIILLENKIIKRQEVEMESLRKRIIAGENEQKKQRALDLERMFQRYQNVKKELENQYKKMKNNVKKGEVGFNPNISKATTHSYASVKGVNQSAQKKRPTNVSFK